MTLVEKLFGKGKRFGDLTPKQKLLYWKKQREGEKGDPNVKKTLSWKWFGKRFRDLTPEEFKEYSHLYHKHTYKPKRTEPTIVEQLFPGKKLQDLNEDELRLWRHHSYLRRYDKIKAYNDWWRENNRESTRKTSRRWIKTQYSDEERRKKYAEYQREYRRRRYAEDPEFRRRCLDQSKKNKGKPTRKHRGRPRKDERE